MPRCATYRRRRRKAASETPLRMGELALRFVLGGLIVSLFAALGELFKPKTFAGMFGAAPSVALASLSIAFAIHASQYVAIELRSMMIGCAALVVYGAACVLVARSEGLPVWLGAGLSWLLCGAAAFGLCGALQVAGGVE